MAKGSGSAGRGGGGARNSRATPTVSLPTIQDVYFGLTDGRADERVLIADLREAVNRKVDQIDDSAFDRIVRRAQLDGKATLMSKDDLTTITNRDRVNAIDINGRKLHIVYLRQ